MLDEVEAFTGRFLVWPNGHYGVTAALWAAHTYAARAFELTPRLLVTAATFGAGKTRVLEVITALSHKAELFSSITPSSLFSMIEEALSKEEQPPTFCLDEVNRWLDEEMISLLNVGYRTGQHVTRVDTSRGRKVIRFPTFAPVAVGGLSMGRMPEDFRSRTIKFAMRRKPPEVEVEKFKKRQRAEAREVASRLASAMAAEADLWDWYEPEMPEGLEDRQDEIWTPLIAIADVAGGSWPDRARAACLHFTSGPTERIDMDPEVRLLPDIRDVYRDLMDARFRGKMISDLTGGNVMPLVDEDHVSGEVLVAGLKERDDMPWGDWSWFTKQKMSRMLGQYNIKTSLLRFRPTTLDAEARGTQRRGYAWSDFAPQWERFPDEG